MAVDATLSLDGGHFRLDLYPGERRDRIADTPPELSSFDPGSTTWVYYDGAALERGHHDPVGIEVTDVSGLTDCDLMCLERLAFPDVVIRDPNPRQETLVVLLRWARDARTVGPRTSGAGGRWPTANAATERAITT